MIGRETEQAPKGKEIRSARPYAEKKILTVILKIFKITLSRQY